MTGSAREVVTAHLARQHSALPNELDRDRADAIIAALTCAGFAIVPVEPTEAMRNAANSKLAHEETATYRGVWQAMLSATRQQEAQT